MTTTTTANEYDVVAKRCKVARILERLDAQSRVNAEGALAGDPNRYRTSRIAEVLGRKVERVSDLTVARHRAGRCCCS